MKSFQVKEVDRALPRASWPIHVFKLGDEPEDDLSSITTPQERLAMMWPLAIEVWSLAIEVWSLAGKQLPSYSREKIPIVYLPPQQDATASSTRVLHEIEGLTVPFIGREELLQNKKASGRPKDLVDVATLESKEG